jgi:DNA-directed RNA polymerase specialized sigma24 family protein
MDDQDWLSEHFEENRRNLRAVAYFMLGTDSDADEALDRAWLRIYRSRTGRIRDVRGWMERVVKNVCFDIVRARVAPRDRPAGEVSPNPVVNLDNGMNRELQAQRDVVSAFLAASRRGDTDAMLAVLDPEVTMRLDRGTASAGAPNQVHGPAAVAGAGLQFIGSGWRLHPVLVNGAAGVVVTNFGQTFSVIGFTFHEGRIAGIDILADLSRLGALDLPVLDE